MIDVDELKTHTDILTLIEQDLSRRAHKSGRWHMVPCPFHADWDKDGGSLGIRPDTGTWRCFGCEEHGDAIAYLQKRHSLTFVDACERLGAVKLSTPRPAAPPVAIDEEPSAEWRRAAAEVVKVCADALFSDAGVKARAWLNKRGIEEWAAYQWKLGYSGGEKIAGVWVERGIVIPWFAEGELWQVKVRRPAGEPRYKALPGGHPFLYGADNLKGQSAAMLVEGELDAILAWQEFGDLVGVATLGSASQGLTDRAISHLLSVARWFVAYDVDEAGENGALRLLAKSPRAQRVRVPKGKDLGEYWEGGGDLRAWAQGLGLWR